MPTPSHIAFLMPSAGWGGIERKNVHFANELARRGIRVDMLLSRSETPPYADCLQEGISVLPLHANHKATAVPKVAAYLNAERPDVLITAKDHGAKVGILAGRLSRARTKVVLGIGNTLSVSERRQVRRLGVRLLYRFADRIFGNSQGVVEDLVAAFGLPARKVALVRNPVVTEELPALSAEAVDHPWLQPERPFATVIACGRLRPQKDFPTLLRALAAVRSQRDCRLVLLGGGSERERLEALAGELGIAEAVSMPGVVANPYAYLAKADLFVLSSLWEGLPNALIEALACGVPCISTDCPSGPREILQEGRFGTLVPMREPEALARAVDQTLAAGVDPTREPPDLGAYRAETATDVLLQELGELLPAGELEASPKPPGNL